MRGIVRGLVVPPKAGGGAPAAHAASHQNGGTDEINVAGLSGELADAQPITVRKNTGADVGTRSRLNLIEGANVTLTIADDGVGDEVDITIAAASGGSTPTGTGFRHVTVGVEDAATKLIDTADINDDQVTPAKLDNGTGFSVLGKTATGAGNRADIVATDETVLGRTAAGNVAFTALATGQIADDAVTYAKIQNVAATARLLGRITAGAGDIEELTGTQATTFLDAFTSALKGLVPASGGSATEFLRADGVFAVPAGGSGVSRGALVANLAGMDMP